MSATLSRYGDGLIEPSVRLIGTYKGVEWVSDRYVMVRTDMWRRQVTPRADGFVVKPLPDKAMRSTLAGIPRSETFGHRLSDLTLDQAFGRTVGFVSAGTALTPFDNRVRPLLEACDTLSVHGGGGSRIAGFQRRPRSRSTVLVCVVLGIRWVGGEFVEVAS